MGNCQRSHIKLLMLLSSICFVLMKSMRREVSILSSLHSLSLMIGIISSLHSHLLFPRTLLSKILFRFLGRRILPFSIAFTSSIKTLSSSKSYRFADQPCKTSPKSNPSSAKRSTAAKSRLTFVTLSSTPHRDTSATL